MYKYDIALSFSSKQEGLVKKVTYYLNAEDLKVFFFPAEQKELMSQNPHESIYRIFQKESLLKVLFVTKEYETSEWTQLEKRCAIRSTKDERKRLIVVNYLGKDLDEELNKYIYIDGNKMYADEIAVYIAGRIKELYKLPRKKEKTVGNIIGVNKGIVTGDNAVFHNIQL